MKMPYFMKNFLHCGLSGWCFEILFTALGSLRNRDFTLKGKTSVWMFPIYGLAAFIPAIYKRIKAKSTLFRSMVYASAIFGCEYTSGLLLKRHNACPWDYSKAKLNYKGVIRLDYAPCWALAGLLFERILCKKNL